MTSPIRQDIAEMMPVLMFRLPDDTPCTTCSIPLDPSLITLGIRDAGPLCEDCAEKLPFGEALWRLVEALDDIDTAVFDLPEVLRPGIIATAHDVIDMIADWRKPRTETPA